MTEKEIIEKIVVLVDNAAEHDLFLREEIKEIYSYIDKLYNKK